MSTRAVDNNKIIVQAKTINQAENLSRFNQKQNSKPETPPLLNSAPSKKFYNLGGNYEIEDFEGKPKLYKVPQYTRQFENRPVLNKTNLGKNAEIESI